MATPSEKREEEQDQPKDSTESVDLPDKRKRNLLEFEDVPPIKQKLNLKYKEKPSCLKTRKLPESSVLSKVKAFLPTFKADNEKILSNAEEHQIESREEDEKVIEMNIALCEMNSSDEESDENVQSSSLDSSSDEEMQPRKKIEEL
ncbi:DgyrCDS717 [Dimorphilus gyrociliatus]|uniref:DgyrCDS717 n=1 Tax=Dimorphilus gyrociliatus TaxID=2664684 RepID=A0A7I8V577_9ANNE|nr:DgyrCDS717 [Dimorphilus gyrociliatus]